ncbi:flagellar hook-basal body complex protein, partial [bacterium]
MLRSLYTAGTGMVAQQHNLDVIANNLANVNTTGFKQQRAEFQDLMYQTMRSAGSADSGTAAPENMQIGLGVKLAGTTSNFRVGSLQNTGNSLNLAISGNGFFKLLRADGTAVYTRDGNFQQNGEGKLVSADGLKLDPEVSVPQGATAITISDT